MKEIIILCGGISSEREQSISSAKEIASVLTFANLVIIDENKLPEWLDSKKHIVFNYLIGEYGEDGGVQKDLEAKNISYTGSDSIANSLCINKSETKNKIRNICRVSDDMVFNSENKPSVSDIINKFGENIIIKPNDKGSSIGLHVLNGYSEIKNVINNIKEGNWIIERRLIGREFTIGILNGKAMGIVEIFAPNGINNYEYKYSTNKKNKYPAELPDDLASEIKKTVEKIYDYCGCRDYARIDLILENNNFYILEINTIPGMTKTSLFPKSASCIGLDFEQVVNKILDFAIIRDNIEYFANKT